MIKPLLVLCLTTACFSACYAFESADINNSTDLTMILDNGGKIAPHGSIQSEYLPDKLTISFKPTSTSPQKTTPNSTASFTIQSLSNTVDNPCGAWYNYPLQLSSDGYDKQYVCGGMASDRNTYYWVDAKYQKAGDFGTNKHVIIVKVYPDEKAYADGALKYPLATYNLHI